MNLQTLISELKREGIQDPKVLDAIAHIPRHLFVPPEYQSEAYENHPLPIGHGQTISQPFIVAQMTELALGGKNLSRVLEVGTGCGYQAAMLSALVEEVYSIERIEDLYQESKQRLNELNYKNIYLKHGDGYEGWPEHAPYQGIIITAAPDHIPEKLLQQLDMGGRMVLPLDTGSKQTLVLIQRQEAGFKRTSIEDVRFVPMLQGQVSLKHRDSI
jgi:protein-L-isoaspartate(D-aspartate) O-methyltransferase